MHEFKCFQNNLSTPPCTGAPSQEQHIASTSRSKSVCKSWLRVSVRDRTVVGSNPTHPARSSARSGYAQKVFAAGKAGGRPLEGNALLLMVTAGMSFSDLAVYNDDKKKTSENKCSHPLPPSLPQCSGPTQSARQDNHRLAWLRTKVQHSRAASFCLSCTMTVAACVTTDRSGSVF